MEDFAERVIGMPEISTDGLHYYETAVRFAFGNSVAYGQIIKSYVGEPHKDAARRYSPGVVVAVAQPAVTPVSVPSRRFDERDALVRS